MSIWEKIWSPSLRNSQNLWQSSFFSWFLCCDFFLGYKSLKSQCHRILHIHRDVMRAANSREHLQAKSVKAPCRAYLQPALAVACHRDQTVSVLHCTCSSSGILPTSHIDYGFRLGLLFWGFVQRALRGGSSGLSVVLRHKSDKSVEYKNRNNAADLGSEC